jgi:hypothetical protein
MSVCGPHATPFHIPDLIVLHTIRIYHQIGRSDTLNQETDHTIIIDEQTKVMNCLSVLRNLDLIFPKVFGRNP